MVQHFECELESAGSLGETLRLLYLAKGQQILFQAEPTLLKLSAIAPSKDLRSLLMVRKEAFRLGSYMLTPKATKFDNGKPVEWIEKRELILDLRRFESALMMLGKDASVITS